MNIFSHCKILNTVVFNKGRGKKDKWTLLRKRLLLNNVSVNWTETTEFDVRWLEY